MQFRSIKSIENYIQRHQPKKNHSIHPALKECAFHKKPSVFFNRAELNGMLYPYINPRCEIDEAVFEKINPYQVRFPLPRIKMHGFHTHVPTSQTDQISALKKLIRILRRILRIQNHGKPMQALTKQESFTSPIYQK